MAKTAARPRAKSASRTAAQARAPANRATLRRTRKKPQYFIVAHARDADFEADGLRHYARDLGIGAASNGLRHAHVLRLIGRCTDEVRKRLHHDTELPLIDVLKGLMKNEFEGHGEQLMEVGSCWLQPPKIKHTVLDYSDDREVLEIIVPVNVTTIESQQ